LDYLLEWEELWARANFQFIANRSGNLRMRSQLAKEAASAYGVVFQPQWPDDDFGAIETAIEAIFKGRGWM